MSKCKNCKHAVTRMGITICDNKNSPHFKCVVILLDDEITQGCKGQSKNES